MTPPLLVFDVAGDVQISRGFSRFAKDIRDLSQAFREIVPLFHETERRQFQTEGAYGSGGWEPLAPSTLARKARGGWPPTILERTSRLRESLTGGPGAIVRIQPMELALGTNVPYGIFHQKGTRLMPARLPIELPEHEKTRWHKVIHRFLVQKMKQDFAIAAKTGGKP